MPSETHKPAKIRFESVRNIPNSFSRSLSKTLKRVQKYPFLVLAGLLILLGITTATASLTRRPEVVQPAPEPKPLEVEVVNVGSQTSNIETTGTVQNLSSITLVAQTAGPISKIHLTEGKTFQKSAAITTQETGYGTGNASAIGAQVAAKNLEIAQITLTNTSTAVSISRQLADQNRDNTEELRKINADSIGGTRKVLDTTRQVIQKLEADLAAASDEGVIQGLRQQLITYQNLFNSTETQLKNLEYSTNTDKAPTKVSNLTKDQVYNSTQLQLDSAQLSRDIAQLNLRSARIQASLSTVKAPFAGSIERILVTNGQYLTPGTPVAVISGAKPELSLVTQLSGFTASRIDENSSLIVTISDTDYSVPISHVSSTPTSGNLYEVLAVLPPEMISKIYEGQSLPLKLPTDSASSFSTNTHFVPLDSVFITNLERYVFLLKDGKAVRTSVETGNIIGNDIEIKKGIQNGDQLIVDRRVIDGQVVISKPVTYEMQNLQYLYSELPSSGRVGK